MDLMLIGCLSIVLACALVTDISTRRIPNWLVLAGLVTGVAVNVLLSFAQVGGVAELIAEGLIRSLFGAVVGLCLPLPLYILRAMGAGDVKLMAVVGAFLGPLPTVGAVLLIFLAGGLLSLAVAVVLGILPRVMANMKLMGFLTFSGPKGWSMMSEIQTNGRLPYAIAIAMGTGLQIWMTYRGGWPFV